MTLAQAPPATQENHGRHRRRCVRLTVINQQEVNYHSLPIYIICNCHLFGSLEAPLVEVEEEVV